MTRTETTSRTTTDSRSRRRIRMLTVLIAAAVAMVGWLIVHSLLGHNLTVTGSGPGATMRVGPLAVVIASLVGGLVAWATLALLERFTERARRAWLILAIVALAVSLSGPIMLAIGTGTTIALLVLHLTVGTVLISGLLRTTRDNRI